MNDNILHAPWTEEQVAHLRHRQHLWHLHEYTCGKCGAMLVPTAAGWRCGSPGCDYTQDWCLRSDAEGKWPERCKWALP